MQHPGNIQTSMVNRQTTSGSLTFAPPFLPTNNFKYHVILLWRRKENKRCSIQSMTIFWKASWDQETCHQISHYIKFYVCSWICLAVSFSLPMSPFMIFCRESNSIIANVSLSICSSICPFVHSSVHPLVHQS